MYLDWTYILVIIGALICTFASANVNSVYKKYAKVAGRSGITGAQTAERILRKNGITDVTIGHVSGSLTDHYDPSSQTVNLSDATYHSSSVAAVAVAAHECGHVIQHHTDYLPIRIRTALVPAANIGSKYGLLVVVIGLFLGMTDTLCRIGIVLFLFGVLFQLVTLPVEFDASHRGLQQLLDCGILAEDEVGSSRKVLKAAAMTYVAAAAASILSLLRLILMVNSRSSRRRR